MSDQDIGKKMVEAEDLHYFLDAYEWTTKEKLSDIYPNESPDFICSRKNGERIGIEITEIRTDDQDAYNALARIYFSIEKKDGLRSSNYGQWADKSILVLKLYDYPLSELLDRLDGLEEDYRSFGFLEIWLADFTGFEAYGDIELFGLAPAKWWGYHQRPYPDRKPYG